jgi:Cft2 family RNA processing exonuclease
MKITNLNPVDEIGASAWLLDLDGQRLLLDAGTDPKREGRASLPMYAKITGSEVEAIAISHCHHDHVGSLPVALRHFPRSHVFMTELSYFLVERVLHNSVNVMKRQRDELGITEYPLYSHDEVDDIAPLFQGCRYGREMEWSQAGSRPGGKGMPTLEFMDAGHALGSAGMLIRGARETLFYTGDVCFRDQTILKGASFENVQADVLLMETTRGNRSIPEGFTREAEANRLGEAIQRILQRKGSVLIPTFALGRTQEILALLALLMAAGKVPRQPVYIGGLGRVFTEIYDLESNRARRNHTGLKLTEALNLVVLERKEMERMKLTGGRLFVMTAGMMNENTAAHELALRMAGDERQAIFFVGYADPNTPGGRLKAAPPDQPFLFSASGGELIRRCEIQDFDLTAHANRDELLEFVAQVSPRVVILGHGEPESRDWFEGRIKELHPRIKVVQPKPGDTVEV